MGDASQVGGEEWMHEALFAVGDVLADKTPIDTSLAQGELVQRIADLDQRQRMALVELVATRGVEIFASAGHAVSGIEVPEAVKYLFTQGLLDSVHTVIKATSGQDAVCEYCLQPVDLEEVEEACKQATLWVSGQKSQNTRMRTYTGTYAHRKCVEERVAKQKTDDTQEQLEL